MTRRRYPLFFLNLLLQKELIEPAVNGTKNVLGAVAKAKDSVKRVVLTSSFAGNYPP